MDATLTHKTLLQRRRLTRLIAQALAERLRSHIATLAPLFRQRLVLGEHVQGRGAVEQVRSSDQAFTELQTQYERVASRPPYVITPELKSPLMQLTTTLELCPWEYEHVLASGKDRKTITVSSPLKFVLAYSGYSPRRLKDLVDDQGRSVADLQIYLLHYLTMHLMLERQPGLAALFDTLHFPISKGRIDGLGELPVTFIGPKIATVLPPDELILESTEMSGVNVFEEIVKVEDIDALRDPLKETLAGIVATAR